MRAWIASIIARRFCNGREATFAYEILLRHRQNNVE